MKYFKGFFSQAIILIPIILIGVLVVVGSCSKNHPTQPPIDTTPVDSVPCDTTFVSVFVLCEKTNITVGFIGIIDQSGPNDYLAQVAGFPDEEISITETRSAPAETTIVRTYEGYTGGRISFKRIRGSRAEAVGVEMLDQECNLK